MKLKYLLAILFAFVSTTAFADDNQTPHNDISFSAGAAIPTGKDTAYLKTAPIISLLYGYRLNRFFQTEGGFQMAFGAANNQNVEASEFGNFVGGDHEFMIPLGGRFFIPLPLQRWQLSVGGGPAYLHYSETAPTAAGSCFTCNSRGGWGFQGLTTVRYLYGDNFYFGTTLQYVSATLNGDAVGSVPATKTNDHWYNVLIGVGLTF